MLVPHIKLLGWIMHPLFIYAFPNQGGGVTVVTQEILQGQMFLDTTAIFFSSLIQL